jgi:thiol-disulfide isomerase/thioredoxin
MTARSSHALASLALVGWLWFVAAPEPARAEARKAEAILHDYDAIELPKFDASKQHDTAYIREFRDTYMKAQARRGDLAWELFLADPNNKRVPALLLERWPSRMMDAATAEVTAGEIDRAMPVFKDKALARTALFMKTVAVITKNHEHPQDSLPIVDRFIREDPKDERCAMLLNGFASTVKDLTLKTELLKRLIAEYPDEPATAQAKAFLELAKKIGKPLPLAFDDAIKGTHVSIEGLKGKVVVLDFWATWCGPCIVEMPKMKELYAKFHDQGVEFIGVSLDKPKAEGGLDKLKEFVARNEIRWPQYYQGNGWESDFSSGLGINAIPQVFLIDAEGKLADIEARGRLETLLPEYIAKAKLKTNSGAK